MHPPAGGPAPEAVALYAKRFFDNMTGAVTAVLISLGEQLGLYRALAGGERLTSAEVAAATGLHERWVREWLHNQAAAGLVEWEEDPDTALVRFGLAPEAVPVVADESSPAYGCGMFAQLPALVRVAERLPEAFVTGAGLTYDDLGPEVAVGIERGGSGWYRAFLASKVVSQIEGMPERLDAGGRVADLGCGAGVGLLALAQAHPAAELHGYEISEHALHRARANLAESAAANVTFHDARTDPMPDDGSMDLVMTLDVLHDMTHPAAAVAAVRAALADDGAWLVAEIKARDSFAENVAKNPMAALMYGLSVTCCMSSALSEPGGAGLGTLGLPASLLGELATAGGFSRMQRLEVDHPINAFYELRR